MSNPSQQPAPQSDGPVKKKMSGKQKALIAGAVVIILALVAVIVFLLLPKEEPVPLASQRVVTDGNLKAIGDDMAAKIDAATFQTYMNFTWNFPDGKSPSSNAVIGNAAVNNYDFYFEVVLPGDEDAARAGISPGDAIYTSGLIPVAMAMDELTLDKDLPAGEYKAVCYFHLMDEYGEEIDSDLGFNITVRVLG